MVGGARQQSTGANVGASVPLVLRGASFVALQRERPARAYIVLLTCCLSESTQASSCCQQSTRPRLGYT